MCAESAGGKGRRMGGAATHGVRPVGKSSGAGDKSKHCPPLCRLGSIHARSHLIHSASTGSAACILLRTTSVTEV